MGAAARCFCVFSVQVVLVGACSSGGSAPPAPDGGGATAALTGTVRDRAGLEVSGAKVEVGSASVFSDAQGRYALGGLPVGPAMVTVTRDWFEPLTTMTTVAAGAVFDITLPEKPLKLEAADRTLAERYAAGFDWTRDKISVAVAARPTRRAFDNAVYFHNPALYRDTAAIPALTPSPQPEISGQAARGFSFPIRSGARMGEEALDLARIADSLAGTPVGPTEPAEFMLWTPMINWLSEWDPARTADLRAVGVAVRQQSWGGNAVRPQDLEKVYLDAQSGELWVKVVFAGFVQLGAGIADDDGDGQKEVFARIPPARYSPEIIQKLTDEYAGKVFTTHGLSKEVSQSLSELYSTTAAVVDRFIGQPFELPGLGTVMYPFVVLRHAGGQRNVILVAP